MSTDKAQQAAMQPEDPGAGGNPDFACQRGEETSQGSPAPKAEKEIASLAARLSTNRANLRILLELCNSGKLPGHGRRQNMLAAASGKAADIWRATMAGARKNRIARLAGKFFQAWQKGGLRFALQKSARKLMPSGRLGLFQSAQKRLAEKGVFEEEKIVPLKESVRLVAFYLPQFHTFPENDAWWGKGFTDWTNVRRARPSFTNHYQPHEPLDDPGYYDLANPEIMRRQADLARRHGIHGFCFHHYYFSGKRLMEKPVDQFVANPDIDIKFCLDWANENWTRRWDGQENEILIAQQHSPEDDIRFWKDASRYFGDPRYIRIDGRPLFLVYHAALFPDMRATLWRWRKWCVEHEEIIPFFVMVQSFFNEDPAEYGFDAAAQFPPHIPGFIPPEYERDYEVEGLAANFAGEIFDYEKMGKFWLSRLSDKYINFPGVFPSWDNTPRRGQKARLFFGSSPAKYEKWLAAACAYAKYELPASCNLVFINAWNEWGEGACLEPDKNYGYAWLNATSRALEDGRRPCPALPLDREHRLKVLFIGHDAGLSGAPKVLLNILRWLARHTSVQARLVTFNEGALSGEYSALFPTLVCPPEKLDSSVLEKFCGGRPDLVFGNTVAAARAYPALAAWDAPFITYAHELEMSLQKYASPEIIACMAEKSALILGAAQGICDNLVQNHGIAAEHCLTIDAFIEPFTPASSLQKKDLKNRLGIPSGKSLVMGCGSRTRRKGFDLFLQAARQIASLNDNVHFCWVGIPESEEDKTGADLIEQTPNLSLPGEVANPADWFRAADVFLLTSREDPFPLACLEAASCEQPVICFAGAGGMPAFIGNDAGRVVPALDVGGMARACAELLANDDLRQKLGQRARTKLSSLHSTDSAVPHILRAMRRVAGKLPPVSVIVPNYNYESCLGDRLKSIIGQTCRDYELILLDDASTDGSAAILRDFAEKSGASLAINAQNSGRVFSQWQKGLEMASGQYVWIAEADDLCAPDFLETMLGHVGPETSLVYAIPQIIDGDGNISAIDYRQNYLAYASSERWVKSYDVAGSEEVFSALAIVCAAPNISAALFRRDAASMAIGEAQKYRCSGDWAFYLCLAMQGRISYCHEALAFHRRHSDSVVAKDQTEKGETLTAEIKIVHDFARNNFDLPAETLAKMDNFEMHVINGQCQF